MSDQEAAAEEVAAPELELLGPAEFTFPGGAVYVGQYVQVEKPAEDAGGDAEAAEPAEGEEAAAEEAGPSFKKVMHGEGKYRIGPEYFEGESCALQFA